MYVVLEADEYVPYVVEDSRYVVPTLADVKAIARMDPASREPSYLETVERELAPAIEVDSQALTDAVRALEKVLTEVFDGDVRALERSVLYATAIAKQMHLGSDTVE